MENTNVITKYNKHFTYDDRIKIQKIITEHRNEDGSLSLKLVDIANMLDKDPSSISKEVKHHRIESNPKDTTQIQTLNKTCKHFDECALIDHVNPYGIPAFCKNMSACVKTCKNFEKAACPNTKKFPWVCNGCPKMKKCNLTKYLYYGDQAQKDYKDTLVECRKGINMTSDEFKLLDQTVTTLIRKGQPIAHICLTNNLGVSERTVYNYINCGYLTAKRYDTRRMVRYKVRYKHKISNSDMKRLKEGRGYEDYVQYSLSHPELNIVQMDTVKGTKDSKKTLLTLHFLKTNFQLAILLPNGEMESVTKAINDIYNTLGKEMFMNMFGMILTDNGVEFADPIAIEFDPATGEQRTKLFFCHAYKSCEKGSCEKNHEYIRYILPKETSFGFLTNEKTHLMMSHINSTVRPSFKCSPYQLMELMYGKEIIDKFKIKKIDPKDIMLKPELLK